MVTQSTEAELTADREIVQSRVFDAPRDVVFDAWTDPVEVAHWWGPNGFSTTVSEMGVRPGGIWRYVMHGPDGTDYPNLVHYIEVVRPERLVYDHGSDDEHPREFHVTVTFTERDGKTELTMRALFPTAADRDYVVREHGAIEGGKQTLQRFADYLGNRTSA